MSDTDEGPWLSKKEIARSAENRKAFEAACGDEMCPNCEHPKKEHCSRNEYDGLTACCPGYCFALDEPGCECSGWAAEKRAPKAEGTEDAD